jgi:hypothetical protein
MDNSFLDDFRTTLESASERLLEIPEAETEVALADGWCAKQVLGHLIDSAANNQSRFVRAQLQDDLMFDGYAQEDWVRVQKYEQEAWVSLVDLWTNYNLHLLNVIENIPQEILTMPRGKHSLDKIAWQTVPANQPTTLEYLIRDYAAHMQDHLKQIFDSVK